MRVLVVNGVYGRPAAGMEVCLFGPAGDSWPGPVRGTIAEDGLAQGWPATALAAGQYRLEFNLDGYFKALGLASFYPAVILPFRVISDELPTSIVLVVTPSSYFVYKTN
jgi:5-hydroxyisourate hydrolase